jgi:hypothetical protein
MNDERLSLPEICLQTMEQVQLDPLNLPDPALMHLRRCAACREARVHWLAQEDFPHALAPSDYFDHLPERILRKVPARPIRRQHPILWIAAGVLAAAASVAGFMAGRANRAPMVEASLPAPSTSTEGREVLPVVPFHSDDDVLSQISTLTPEESADLAKRLGTKTQKPDSH